MILRLLYLMFCQLMSCQVMGWLALLARSSATKNAERHCCVGRDGARVVTLLA